MSVLEAAREEARRSEQKARGSEHDDVQLETKRVEYNDSISRWFAFASMGWGIVGMLVGALAALQMAWWPANFDPHFAFGRIRPLHTNAVIFAFVGNMVFAGIYYST